VARLGLCRTRSDRFAITLCHPRKPAPVSCLAPCRLCRLSGNPSISLLSGDHRPKRSCGLVSNRYCREVDRSPGEQLLQPGPWRHILSEARPDDRGRRCRRVGGFRCDSQNGRNRRSSIQRPILCHQGSARSPLGGPAVPTLLRAGRAGAAWMRESGVGRPRRHRALNLACGAPRRFLPSLLDRSLRLASAIELA
jgi:hypothetical protein